MSISTIIEEYLSKYSVAYDLFTHEHAESLSQAARILQIPKHSLARAVVLTDGDQYLMAVLPLSHILDFSALKKITGMDLEPVPAQFSSGMFPDCQASSIPLLGEAYGMETIYDNSLYSLDSVVFEAGHRGTLIRVYGNDFKRLTEGSSVENFSRPEQALGSLVQTGNKIENKLISNVVHDLTPESEVIARIKNVYELPMLPVHARKILEIRDNPNATAVDLAKIVELDPSLSAQVLRYATSPFFGYKGEIKSIQAAISQVLGFDMVMNLALGLASLKPFRNPPDGPLGLNAFWRHATLSAALSRELAGKMPKAERPEAGQIYLAGLLHNFGFLLFGHLFQPEFYLLNKIIEANPTVAVAELEKQILGMGQAKDVMGLGHAHVGSILLESWNMPESIRVITREHHNENYQGPHEISVKLMLVTDRLLRRFDIGDGCSTQLPVKVMEVLGLEEERIMPAVERLIESTATIDGPGGASVA